MVDALIILTFICIIGLVTYLIVRSKLRRFSRTLFGTDSLVEGLKQQERELAETPKSVSSMTSIYMPLIHKDFPDFNISEFVPKAENMLLSAFNAIETRDTSKISHASKEVMEQVRSYIEDLDSKNEVEHYDNVNIHKTAVTNYRKENGLCVITFQSSLEFYRYIIRDRKVVSGRKDLKEQTKYNIDLIYVQDVDKLNKHTSATSVGINCPNCGGPVKNLGSKYCEFCGTGIQELHTKTWKFSKYSKVN